MAEATDNGGLFNTTALLQDMDGIQTRNGWTESREYYILRIIVIVIITFLDISTNILALIMLIVIPKTSIPSNSKFLMMSLCAANLTIGFLAAFHVLPAILGEWPYGWFICHAFGRLTHAFVAAAVLSLIYLSIDRYIAILRPLRYHLIVNRRRLCIAVGIVWCLPFVGLSISFSYLKSYPFAYSYERCACHRVIPDTSDPAQVSEIRWTKATLELCIMCALTLIETFTFIFIYSWILCITNAQIKGITDNATTTNGRHQLGGIKSADKNVLRMLAATTIAYLAAWPPLYVTDVLLFYGYDVPEYVIFGIFWLSQSSWIQVLSLAATSTCFQRHALQTLQKIVGYIYCRKCVA